MATLPQNLLATAELLAKEESALGSAPLRRAVSTAYYALFSRLTALCATRLARTAPTADSFKSVYRSVDHSHARSVLSGHPEFGTTLGEAFKSLQEARHWADYSIDGHPDAANSREGRKLARSEALRFVDLAREAVATVDVLSSDAKQRLAIALATRSRR